MDNRVAVKFKPGTIVAEVSTKRFRIDKKGKEVPLGDAQEKLTVDGVEVEPTKDGRYLVHPDRANRFAIAGRLDEGDEPAQSPAHDDDLEEGVDPEEAAEHDTDVEGDRKSGRRSADNVSKANRAADREAEKESRETKRAEKKALEDGEDEAVASGHSREARERPGETHGQRGTGGSTTGKEPSGRTASDVGLTRQQLAKGGRGARNAKTGGTTRSERRQREAGYRNPTDDE